MDTEIAPLSAPLEGDTDSQSPPEVVVASVLHLNMPAPEFPKDTLWGGGLDPTY
jgi:hypothetical protein